MDYREKYENVQPLYHMNKDHWNTVTAGNKISVKKLLWMIDRSYNQVVKGFSKKQRDALNSQ